MKKSRIISLLSITLFAQLAFGETHLHLCTNAYAENIFACFDKTFSMYLQ